MGLGLSAVRVRLSGIPNVHAGKTTLNGDKILVAHWSCDRLAVAAPHCADECELISFTIESGRG
jgi:hypothetical protein